MVLENGTDFFSNKVILITGATGFLAKVLVEKILRAQPTVKKLYLLVRANNVTSSHTRLSTEIIRKDLFNVLREQHNDKFDDFISEKVAPVAGDTSLPNLGINETELLDEIDAVIHVAATTRFQESYDIALGINTMGAMNVINFAKMCSQLQVLIHVSTAYVCGDSKGLIVETPCKMGETLSGRLLDIDAEHRLIDDTLHKLQSNAASPKEIRRTMRSLGQQRAEHYGWPNTYVFTKAMAEMIIWKHKSDLPVVIVRPTMICSTLQDPFPGWIEGSGSAAALSIVYGKGFVNYGRAHDYSVFDLIPADMVVNSIIVAMVANANKSGLTIYQVGSSLRNPITLGKLLNFNFDYFNKTPWVDDQGLIVKIKMWKTLETQAVFLLLLAFHLIKLLVLKIPSVGAPQSFKLGVDKLEWQLKVTYKVTEQFKSYLCFMGIFDDKNTENLRTWMNKAGIDKEIFSFHTNRIDWQDFLINVHIPATVKYLF